MTHGTRWLRCVAVPLTAILLLIVLAAAPARSQQVGRWDIVDSAWAWSDGIDAADRDHFALIERWNSEEPPHIAQRVRRSTDAGRTWSVVLLEPTDNFRFTGIEHPSPDVLLVLAERDTTEEIPNGWRSYAVEWMFARSTDGGVSWQREHTRRIINSIAMFDASSGYRLRGGIIDTIESTRDAGATWSVWSSGDLGVGTDILYAREQSMILLVYDLAASEYRLRRTDDAGATWTELPSLPAGIPGVFTLDGTTLWAAGARTIGGEARDLIYRSVDGGRTWKASLDRKSFGFGLRGIRFADEMNGIAFGASERLLRTRDGGASWTPEFIPWSVGIYESVSNLAYPAPDIAIGTLGRLRIVRYGGEEVLLRPTFVAPSTDMDQRPLEDMIEWTPIEGATAYDLQIMSKARSEDTYDPTGYADPYLDDSLMSTTSRPVTLEPNRRYAARVRARNATQVSDWSSELFFLSIRTAGALSHPNFTKASQVGSSSNYEFEWSSVDDAVAYDFVLSRSPSLTPAVQRDTGLTVTATTVANLAPNTLYWAAVRARDESRTSEWESVRLVTEGPSGVSVETGMRAALSVSVAPNPVPRGGEISLDVVVGRRSAVTVAVYSHTGARLTPGLTREMEAGGGRFMLQVPDAPAGTLWLQVSAGEERRTIPVVMAP